MNWVRECISFLKSKFIIIIYKRSCFCFKFMQSRKKDNKVAKNTKEDEAVDLEGDSKDKKK